MGEKWDKMGKGAKAAAIGAGALGLLGGYTMIQSSKAKKAIGEAFMPGISGGKGGGLMKKGGKLAGGGSIDRYKDGGIVQHD